MPFFPPPFLKLFVEEPGPFALQSSLITLNDTVIAYKLAAGSRYLVKLKLNSFGKNSGDGMFF